MQNLFGINARQLSQSHLKRMSEVKHRIGCFWWEGELCRKKQFRLESIRDYFTEDRLRELLVPIITKEGGLSLRALDWLVTNYAKKTPIVYKVTPPNCPETVVNVHRYYKKWLWSHKRKNFDPFRRGTRVYFDVDGVSYESTVGQLNFFYWASRYGILEYAKHHISEIEKDQAQATKVPMPEGAVTGKKRKRRQLSQAPKEAVFVYPATIRVVFNPEVYSRAEPEKMNATM
jgi:hypothetical protein